MVVTVNLYIKHEDMKTPENGTAYFGPFDSNDIQERLDDAYGNALADSGPLYAITLTDEEATTFTINNRKYWMARLKEMTS